MGQKERALLDLKLFLCTLTQTGKLKLTVIKKSRNFQGALAPGARLKSKVPKKALTLTVIQESALDQGVDQKHGAPKQQKALRKALTNTLIRESALNQGADQQHGAQKQLQALKTILTKVLTITVIQESALDQGADQQNGAPKQQKALKTITILPTLTKRALTIIRGPKIVIKRALPLIILLVPRAPRAFPTLRKT